MSKYKISGTGIKREVVAYIPKDPANHDYQVYLLWLEGKDEEGNDLGTGPNEPDPEFTEVELAERDRQEQLAVKLRTLKSHDIGLFKMIYTLFQVGKDKGLLAASDFPAALVSSVQEWKTIIDEIDTLEGAS